MFRGSNEASPIRFVSVSFATSSSSPPQPLSSRLDSRNVLGSKLVASKRSSISLFCFRDAKTSRTREPNDACLSKLSARLSLFCRRNAESPPSNPSLLFVTAAYPNKPTTTRKTTSKALAVALVTLPNHPPFVVFEDRALLLALLFFVSPASSFSSNECSPPSSPSFRITRFCSRLMPSRNSSFAARSERKSSRNVRVVLASASTAVSTPPYVETPCSPPPMHAASKPRRGWRPPHAVVTKRVTQKEGSQGQ